LESTGYLKPGKKSRKTTEGKKRGRNKAQKQIIRKAVQWKKILADGGETVE
jgi:hypothetical protein